LGKGLGEILVVTDREATPVDDPERELAFITRWVFYKM
jgi:hypothetical protein